MKYSVIAVCVSRSVFLYYSLKYEVIFLCIVIKINQNTICSTRPTFLGVQNGIISCPTRTKYPPKEFISKRGKE